MFCSAVPAAAIDLYLDVRSQIEDQIQVSKKDRTFAIGDPSFIL